MLDHAGRGAQPRRELPRISHRPEVVGDQPAVGALGPVAKPRLTEFRQRAPHAEAHQLERNGRPELADGLLLRGDHDEDLRRRRDYLLARQRSASALHEPRTGVDLVGAVDRDVQIAQLVEVRQLEPQRKRGPFGRGRGRGAAHVRQPPLGDRRQQVRDRRARAEADAHPVLHHLGRRLRGVALVALPKRVAQWTRLPRSRTRGRHGADVIAPGTSLRRTLSAGTGGCSRQPWPTEQSSSRASASWRLVSMPTATAVSPAWWASAIAAANTARLSLSPAKLWISSRSSLIVSRGRFLGRLIEDSPAPKLSSAIATPRRLTSASASRARSGSRRTASSLTSRHSARPGSRQ